MIPHKIIDNSDVKLSTFLNEVLNEIPDTQFDIATAFFNIQAFALIKDNLQGVKQFRLLLGRVPDVKTNKTLGDVLMEMIKEEVEGFDLCKDKDKLVKEFIAFLKKDNVEVRLYEKQFLHGKAYIFDKIVVIGSSNFTPSGLTLNTELNSIALESEAQYVRTNWFDKFWNEATEFKSDLISLLKDSRFGNKEYSPYEVYIKTLFELQKDEIKADVEDESSEKFKPLSRVDLAEFQEDAVKRVFSRLRKYRACMVADSVGLGKTWIAKRIIEEFGFYKRRKFLIICPAQLRQMWRDEVKDLILADSVISQEDVSSPQFVQKAKEAIGGRLEEVSLIVVDESHNFRNPLSSRWENLFSLIVDHIAKESKERPYILFLTATPINNTIWDLYWQVMLMTMMNQKAFLKEGISDIFKFFKNIEKQGDTSLLNDIMNEISIRRTRDYIKENYPDAEIKGKRILFPKRILQNINYQLDVTYKGLYKDISKTISEGLTMAYYRILKYKKQDKLSQAEEMSLGRMIALEGIFRTILLKRLESSVEAFRKSLMMHVRFLEKLKEYLSKGKLLTKQGFYKYVSNLDEEDAEDIIEELEDINLKDYRYEDLITDIDKDISLFNEMHQKVSGIDTGSDAKLKELKSHLINQCGLTTSGSDNQVVIFTYYADTLDYVYKSLINDPDFSHLKIANISGRITSAKTRSDIVSKFMSAEIDILISTDVLSEGMNLQRARYLINYDLHWNPTRMIQRAGRIDRIGSPYDEIFVYNFFPEEELEDLLRLVQILQSKIRDIDSSVGLDATVLGEEISPKVFGIIRRIKDKDNTVFDDLEREVFGGGERFYQPLMNYLKTKTLQYLNSIPLGIYSGLKKGIKGIFFYYRYKDDFHFWYLYDITTGQMIKNRTKILDYIACPPDEARVIPDFFDKVYDINLEILKDIEASYKEVEQREIVDPSVAELSSDMSRKFVLSMIREIDIQIDDYILDFPEDKAYERLWEETKEKLLSTSLTKRRLKGLRAVWRDYKDLHKNWKKLLKDISEFLTDKAIVDRETIDPYEPKHLKLITIDFVS
ncbi:MAG: helicase-related protein [Thermodesulfovibrionales bacterium]|nr:helicase-related protein [Thermodesulfovibrionales bacterium]